MANNSNNSSSNKLLVPGAQNAIDQMKYEIASEQGVQLGADATARQKPFPFEKAVWISDHTKTKKAPAGALSTVLILLIWSVVRSYVHGHR